MHRFGRGTVPPGQGHERRDHAGQGRKSEKSEARRSKSLYVEGSDNYGPEISDRVSGGTFLNFGANP